MSVKDFKSLQSLPTFDEVCRRLADMEQCVAAQGEMLLHLMQEMQEREYELTFLMNISFVTVPTSKIADASGKIPAVKRSARDVYMESGRAAVMAMFQARAKAEQDAQNLSQAADAPQESPEGPANGEASTSAAPDFRVPGKVTH